MCAKPKSSGYPSYGKMSKASVEIGNALDALHGGQITLGTYVKQKAAVASKYGLSPKEAGLAVAMAHMQTEDEKKQAYEEEFLGKSKSDATQQPSKDASAPQTGSKAQAETLSTLPGQNGNPWPPNVDSKHLDYDGGGGLGIWNQFGGGVQNGGVSNPTAKKMNTAVKSFTGSGYSSIRKAQQAGDTMSATGQKGVLCEQFIEAGIKSGNGWNGGPTYRGIGGLSDAAWNALRSKKPGEEIDCNFGATASWSTHRQTSEHFGGSHNHITFVHLGSSQKGVSVDRISTCMGENEVLVSKDARFRVVAVADPVSLGYNGSQTYIYVEDID